MARIRTVKPELFRHEGLFELEEQTGLPIRLAFIGLFTACDRQGRFKWSPRALKLDALPYDSIDFSRVLDALMTRGFIQRYTVNGTEYGYIPSFLNHQQINNREQASRIPAPDGSTDSDASSTCEEHDDDAPSGEGKGKEGKGREEEGKGKEGDNNVQLHFEEFWSEYPIKHGKKNCRAVFLRHAKKGVNPEKIVSALRALKLWCENAPEGEFIPPWKYPLTWLNGEHWEDELPAYKKKPQNQPRGMAALQNIAEEGEYHQ